MSDWQPHIKHIRLNPNQSMAFRNEIQHQTKTKKIQLCASMRCGRYTISLVSLPPHIHSFHSATLLSFVSRPPKSNVEHIEVILCGAVEYIECVDCTSNAKEQIASCQFVKTSYIVPELISFYLFGV